MVPPGDQVAAIMMDMMFASILNLQTSRADTGTTGSGKPRAGDAARGFFLRHCAGSSGSALRDFGVAVEQEIVHAVLADHLAEFPDPEERDERDKRHK